MDKNILTKEEVIKITNEYYISYYCKNDICVLTDYNYANDYIEFPDNNGNLIKYISNTCSYNNIETDNCYSINCNNDKDCLSNKCYKSHCMFNNETEIIHCDDIYIKPTILKSKSSYMHCGKAYGDTCKYDDECSSKQCENNYCLMQKNGPSDSEGMGIAFELLIYIFIFIVIILLITLIIYVLYKIYNKYHKIKSKD